MSQATTARPIDAAALARGYENRLLPRRWAGAWIDFVVLALGLVIPDAALGNDLYRSTLPIWLGLIVLYFPLSEGLTGRSLGKVVTGTVVVTADGSSPGMVRAVKRTIARLLEVNPILFGGIPAGIAVNASANRQRLGDRWAGTYVVLAQDLSG
jgi:uncharacterized RDD family membrane protein YckC